LRSGSKLARFAPLKTSGGRGRHVLRSGDKLAAPEGKPLKALFRMCFIRWYG
jgi:hypothetical protein